jgi:hypothetical protein
MRRIWGVRIRSLMRGSVVISAPKFGIHLSIQVAAEFAHRIGGWK